MGRDKFRAKIKAKARLCFKCKPPRQPRTFCVTTSSVVKQMIERAMTASVGCVAKLGMVAVVFLAGVSIASAAVPLGTIAYSCNDGTAFSIAIFSNDETYQTFTATIKVNGDASQQLTSTDGAHYRGTRYSFDEWKVGEVELFDSSSGRKSTCHPISAEAESEAAHTTRYRGMYLGEVFENVIVQKSGCKLYEDSETVLSNIINGRSRTECLIDIDIDPSYKKTISKIVVFTRTPFMQEYRVLVSQYGASLPGRRSESSPSSQDDTGSCIVWRTKDSTEIWECQDFLKKSGSAENAYQESAIPCTTVIFR